METIPRMMHAAYIERRGSADEIVYGELPVPEAGPGQVLVRVEGVAVNPVDTYIRSGAYPTEISFPFVIGRDLVGVVAEVGAGVTRFSHGQRVWCNSLGYDGRQGSFAGYASVDQDRLYPLPENVDPLWAVAVFHPAVTAFTGLVHPVGRIGPGDILLVGGGAGSVGSALVQMARAMGARVIATAHGAGDQAWCRRCGAEFVFDYRDPDWAKQVRRVAPDGVDVVWNTSGYDDLVTEVNLLAQGGCLVLMAGLDQRPEFPVGPFYTRNARAVGFTISSASVAELGDAARAINQMLAAGRLAVRIAKVLPLSQAAEAHRLVEGSGPSGKIHGRVVLHPEG